MMNKKGNVFLLILAGALVLNGCEENKETVNKEENVSEIFVNTNEESANDTTSKEDTTSQSGIEATEEPNTKEQSEEAKITKSMPAVTVTSVRKEWYTDDNVTVLLEAEESKVSVENEGFAALNNALTERFAGIEEDTYEQLLESAKEHYEVSAMEDVEYFPTYYSNEVVELARCDSSVLSLRIYYGDYTGGAHGMYAYDGATFDVESGKELSISDILTDKAGFYETAPAYIADVLYEEYGDELFPEYRECVDEAFGEDGSLNWYLNATGIVVIYNPYELGPYAMGEVEVVLPYEEFAKYIDTKYISVQGEVVARIPANEEIGNFLGENSTICLKTQWNEYDMLNVSIVAGETEESIGEFGRFCDAYAIKRKDGRSFLLVTCDGMSDDYVTFVYEVTEGTITKCDELGGAAITGGTITPDKIELSMRLDVLGTYSAQMDYKFDENGKLTQAEDVFSIESTTTLKIIKPLPVILEGEEVLLNVDTLIRLTGTNNVNEVYFEVLETKTMGVIYYELDEESPWIHMIEGVSEYEYFESLPYAG